MRCSACAHQPSRRTRAARRGGAAAPRLRRGWHRRRSGGDAGRGAAQEAPPRGAGPFPRPPAPSRAEPPRAAGGRLPLLPPMRMRLVEVPFGLDYPYWVDDGDFDLDFHVRELALPPPGTDQQLAEQVSRIASRPLDRARPLWELYLIHGLPNGNVA